MDSELPRDGAESTAMGGLALPGLGLLRETAFDTVSGQLANRLRREIQRGDLVPGERLRQRELATRFRVSTTPVREALQALHAEGFVDMHPHRGTVVVAPLSADIEEIYAIREALEGLAVTHAIHNITPKDRARLSEMLQEMEMSKSLDNWARIDQEFHLYIYQLASMPRLTAIVMKLRAAFAYYVEDAYEDPDRRDQAMRDHRLILSRCLDGDEEAARAAVACHLENTARVIRASLRAGAKGELPDAAVGRVRLN